MIDFLLLVAGIVLLVVGGDILVRGAVAIAERLEIPPLIIGLTIVSLGTSAPELFISVQAALAGSGGLAVGNVVGSNIANVLLVLGLPAIIHATHFNAEGVGKSIVVMIAISVVFIGMLATGELGFYNGFTLIVLLLLFLWDQYQSALKKGGKNVPDYHDEVHDLPKSPLISIGLLIAGMILLPAGAWLTVEGATGIARAWGVSDEVIGLTIVAIGTSLPELAASLMAVFRGSSNVAIGNVVGSNIFNIAAIMGITTIITPVAVSGHIIKIDMWIMLVATLFVAWLASHKGRISRRSGLVMTSAYAIYIVAAFAFK